MTTPTPAATEMAASEKQAFITIEMMDRFAGRAARAVRDGDIDRALLLLDAVFDVARERMATEVKDQTLSDAITANAVVRVRHELSNIDVVLDYLRSER